MPKVPACAKSQTRAAFESLEDKPFANCIARYRPHAYKPSTALGNARQVTCRLSKLMSVCLSTQQIAEQYLHVGRWYTELLLQSIWQTLQYALLLLLHSLIVLLLLNSLIMLLLLLLVDRMVQLLLLLLHSLIVL